MSWTLSPLIDVKCLPCEMKLNCCIDVDRQGCTQGHRQEPSFKLSEIRGIQGLQESSYCSEGFHQIEEQGSLCLGWMEVVL